MTGITRSVFEALEKVEQESSRTKKIEIIEEVSSRSLEHEETMKEVLVYALDPYRTFGVTSDKKWKISDYVGNEEGVTANFFDVLDLLEAREITGNAAVHMVQQVVCSAPCDLFFKWFKRILDKDLRCGVKKGTVDKIWPGLIPGFDVQLAKPLKDYSVLEEGKWVASPKLDGLRCIMILEEGDVKILTRNGKPLNNLDHIAEELIEAVGYGWVYDGEIFAGDWASTASMTKSEEADASDAVYYIFDGMSLEEWKRQNCVVPHKDRQAKVIQDTYELKYSKWVPEIYLDPEDVHTDLQEVFSQALRDGYEGVVLKEKSSLYEFKRSKYWLKYKPEHSDDYEIIDVVEGEGKFEGTLGAIVVDVGGVEVNVGTGYDYPTRNRLWQKNMVGELVGSIVEVKYQEKTPDGSLRFPVFLRLREDK